jgi:hypothetical protein
VPYQLHCWPLTTELRALLETELLGTVLGALDEITLERAAELVTPEQTLPVTCGTSALPPFLLTWTPKATLWPGWILPFQPRLDAV